jgi:hypothetical protein
VIPQPIVLDKKTPSGGVSAETDKDPFCTVLGNLCDDIDGVINIGSFRGAPFRQSSHTGEERDLLPPGEEARAQRTVHSLSKAIVEGEHVVATRFDQE